MLLALMAAAMLFQRQRPMPFFGLVVLSFVITGLWRPGIAPIETARSFFGVHRVAEVADGKARILYHGTTIHGAQRLRNEDGTPVDGPPLPQTYYPGGRSRKPLTPPAPRGAFRLCRRGRPRYRTLACHRKAGEHWTFYEIDPEVIRIARDPICSVHVDLCGRGSGHGRRRAADAGGVARALDLIVLDAFSSDTIPGIC